VSNIHCPITETQSCITGIFFTTYLGFLCIYGCSDLTISPEISVALHSLESLVIDECSHVKLEELFGELTSLQNRIIWDHEKLEELPNNVRQFLELHLLTLKRCGRLRQLPQWLGEKLW
jgi:hypothetical protein